MAHWAQHRPIWQPISSIFLFVVACFYSGVGCLLYTSKKLTGLCTLAQLDEALATADVLVMLVDHSPVSYTPLDVYKRQAFDSAGGQSRILVVRNQTPADLKESIVEMTKALKESHILMLPGGFSAGDEPEGAGKFITSVFRDPFLTEAVAEHLEKKNLILGICNGFQALVKLGLLPYGEIRELKADDPTLTFNHIGRHVSTMVKTKLISKLSPWFSQAELGAVYTVPVSHGEGRFVATMKQFGDMIANGQIATQYVNNRGKSTMIAPDNPNGSMMAVEGITSKDGLILGKMGHSERYRKGLYKNVPGEYDQKIFQSGIAYFK